MINKIKIQKLDAAVSQLDTAIDLWFRGKDFASIVTLAAAAHEVIAAIVDGEGTGITMYDFFKDEYRKEGIRILRRPQNFLKHADKDPAPDGFIEVWDGYPEFLMVFCLMGLDELKHKRNAVRRAFFTWFLMKNPDLLTEEAKAKLEAHLPKIKEAVSGITKAEYYEHFLLGYPQMQWRD